MGLFRKYILVVAAVVLLASGCNNPDPVITDAKAYRESVEEWRKLRLKRLKGRNGWLNLAGLYWLEEGANSFGSDRSNDVVFPEKAGPFCGALFLREGEVRLQVNEGCRITAGDSLVRELVLKDDHSDNTTLLRQGDLAWYVIRRGEKTGIRLRDYDHPRIGSLDHIPAYPAKPEYVVEAHLDPFDEPRPFEVATPVEGYTETYDCPGELHFRLGKRDLVLYPFTAGRRYFIVFADETTGTETYGAGRFMYAAPDSTGRIVLDFNKAYNPPCAFSPHATCPMPPRENFLPVPVTAGEKSVHLE